MSSEAERVLADARKELEDIKFALDASSILAITDAGGKILSVNDKFCEISGYSRQELIGKTHRIINSGYHSKEFFQKMWGTIDSGRVWRGDVKNKAKDGNHYWVATTIVPFLDASGKPYQHLAIRSEITARKLAEEQLERAVHELAEMSQRERARAEALDEANRRIIEEQAKVIQAEKLSSIGLLSAGVAHEINNPLAGVMACVKALREGSVAPARREEYFEAVRDGLERIRMTVKGLLDYSRPQPTSVTSVDVAETVRGCLLLLAAPLRKKNVEVAVEIPEGEFLVRGNRPQLMQAAMNVLLNALYVSPDGARIEVTAAREAGRIALAFKDHGPGIPKEMIAKVCDPFFTTKPQGEGTGLGLAVTLGILESHGGSLQIESEPGAGTTVIFRLPVAN